MSKANGNAGMRVVILAGGKGARLKPYTTILPKPLMPLDDMPILEVILRQLRQAGFSAITIAVGHLAGLIGAYFGDGSKWGVKIDYALEHQPLGTAGPLASIDDLGETFLVMNGDVLTTLDYRELVNYHRQRKGLATVAMYNREIKINLGVLKTNDRDEIYDYVEKPVFEYQASMGIYVFESRILKYLDRGKPFDLPDLIKALIKADEVVNGFRFNGYWRDIGRREDYEQAVEEFKTLRGELLR